MNNHQTDKITICNTRKTLGLSCKNCTFYYDCNPEFVVKKKEEPRSCIDCKHYRQKQYRSSCALYPGIGSEYEMIPCSSYEKSDCKKKKSIGRN